MVKCLVSFIKKYTHLIVTITNLVRVNLSEGDELHIRMADNRSTNTPVVGGVGSCVTIRGEI